MNSLKSRTFLAAALPSLNIFPTLAPAQTAPVQAHSPDKSQYTLFNPTPRSQMRDMATDRPDTTESPITVDAGHFQVELSFLEYAHDHQDNVETDSYAILPSNLKVGPLNNLDLQLLFTPYEINRTRANGHTDESKGFSDDTQIRLKLNLWGDDPQPDAPQEGAEGTNHPGHTSAAIMPFVKLPTGEGDLSNDHVEGGLIFPLAVDLPGDFGLGLMAEIDLLYDEAQGHYRTLFVHTATLGHDVPGIENLTAYLEYVGLAPHDLTGTTYQAIGSAGLVYQLTDDWTLDAGGTIGIPNAASDLTLFAGTSFRF